MGWPVFTLGYQDQGVLDGGLDVGLTCLDEITASGRNFAVRLAFLLNSHAPLQHHDLHPLLVVVRWHGTSGGHTKEAGANVVVTFEDGCLGHRRAEHVNVGPLQLVGLKVPGHG